MIATRPLAIAALSALLFACSDSDPTEDSGSQCGPGTSLAGGVCVPDGDDGEGEGQGEGSGGDPMGGGGGEGGGDGKRVFVTRTAYRGDLGGSAGADGLCGDAAIAAGLGGAWAAWLSGDDGAATSRVSGEGPWHDLDGRLVFANHAALSTSPRIGIEIQEDGVLAAVGDPVWTGTGAGGTLSADCIGWTYGVDYYTATHGRVGTTDGSWTDAGDQQCDSTGRLYCFEL
jgi:hypothetical protein